MKTSLSRNDWVKAAARALTSGGPQAVKVEQLARDLKVSKGSFYWHFKNAEDLKHTMLKVWVELGTNQVINHATTTARSPQEKLEAFSKIITENRDVEFKDYGGIMIEAAIRDWSRFDTDVAKVVKKINKIRLAYIVSLFSNLGIGAKECELKANIFHSALIGLEFLEHQGLAKMNTNMQALIIILTKSGE